MTVEHKDSFGMQARPASSNSTQYITGDSDAAHALRQMAALAASCDSPMMVSGPYGCGKEHVARYIHAESNRRRGPFVKINCGIEGSADDANNAHTAFSRQQNRQNQNLEAADGGTLLLDNADEMSIDVQTLILQLIEQQGARSATSHGRPPLNIRVIAASNHSIATMVSEGSFRQDLFYRLNTLSLPVPPLRQRREDIDLLMTQFLLKKNIKRRFTADWGARQTMRTHRWPGNIRELYNLVARGCLFHPGQTIGTRRMTALLAMGEPLRSGPATQLTSADMAGPLSPGFNLKSHLDEEETRFLKSALQQANGIVQHAADLSGVKRTTFIEKMRKHGIERQQFKR